MPEWTLVDEAITNLGYMQMKKTRDAAMVLVERMYGRKPAVNYYIGTSQGGREALTVAQRYPDDYDGIISNVPIPAASRSRDIVRGGAGPTRGLYVHRVSPMLAADLLQSWLRLWIWIRFQSPGPARAWRNASMLRRRSTASWYR